ncbi:hypothetical protein CN918_28610 [Priestia megaterium]|nr:hypothetical protein CN918_28610 [Priestia megaterium]
MAKQKSNLARVGVILACVIIGAIVIGIIVYNLSMKPNKEKTEEIQKDAKSYIEEHFDDSVHLYGTLYDNMGNMGYDYAAKAEDKKTGTQFVIYRNDETNKLVDTYVSQKWSDDVRKDVLPYVHKKFGKKADVLAYYDDEIGAKLHLTPSTMGSYKERDVYVTVRVSLPRKKKSTDNQEFKEMVSYLKQDLKIKSGQLIVGYVAENGEILEDKEWQKTFGSQNK